MSVPDFVTVVSQKEPVAPSSAKLLQVSQSEVSMTSSSQAPYEEIQLTESLAQKPRPSVEIAIVASASGVVPRVSSASTTGKSAPPPYSKALPAEKRDRDPAGSRCEPFADGYDPDAPVLRRPFVLFNFDGMVDFRRLVTSHCLRPEWLLAFRVLGLVMYIAWFASSLIDNQMFNQQVAPDQRRPLSDYVFFFTSINLLSLFAFFIVSTIYTACYVGQLRKLPAAERLAMRHTAVDGPMPTCFAVLPRWINTITWIHANLQLPFHFIVIIVFWAVLFPLALPGMNASGIPVAGFWLWTNLGIHAFTFVFSFVDFMIGRYGIPGFLHSVFPLGFIFLYACYSFVQYAIVGRFPYGNVMNPYVNSGAWIFYVGVAILTAIAIVFATGMQAWRDNGFRCCGAKKGKKQSKSQPVQASMSA